MLGLQSPLKPHEYQAFISRHYQKRLIEAMAKAERNDYEVSYINGRIAEIKLRTNEKDIDTGGLSVARFAPRKNTLRKMPETICQ